MSRTFNTMQGVWMRGEEVGGSVGGKGSRYQFSLSTSTNVGISPLVQNFKAIPNVSRKLLDLNQDDTSKKGGFSGQIRIKLRL